MQIARSNHCARIVGIPVQPGQCNVRLYHRPASVRPRARRQSGQRVVSVDGRCAAGTDGRSACDRASAGRGRQNVVGRTSPASQRLQPARRRLRLCGVIRHTGASRAAAVVRGRPSCRRRRYGRPSPSPPLQRLRSQQSRASPLHFRRKRRQRPRDVDTIRRTFARQQSAAVAHCHPALHRQLRGYA